MINVFSQNHALIIQRQAMVEGYPFQSIERVYGEFDNVNQTWLLVVKFQSDRGCAEDKLKLRLSHITNQPTWTDNTNGVIAAVTDVLNWSQPLSAGLASEATLAQIETNTDNLETLLTADQRTVQIIRVTNAGSTPAGAYSVSFASTGLADALVTGTPIRSGEVVNVDGGVLNNTLGAIAYDASATNAELLITILT